MAKDALIFHFYFPTFASRFATLHGMAFLRKTDLVDCDCIFKTRLFTALFARDVALCACCENSSLLKISG